MRRKAQVTLTLMLLTAVAIFVAMVIAHGINSYRQINIESQLNVKVLVNDRGSELLGLLSSKTADVPNGEIIGNTFAKGFDTSTLASVKSTLLIVGREGGRYAIIFNKTRHKVTDVNLIGEREELEELEAKIPIPGGAPGGLSGYVRIA